MKTIEVVEKISTDFTEQNGPFDDVTFPEERLLSELIDDANDTMEDRMIFVSMFSTFDYNRDANQLVDNIIELWEEKWWTFSCGDVARLPVEELADVLEQIGFRYPNRDAQAWHKNCTILMDKYNGQWTELLLSARCDAPALVERLEQDDFNCLKGVKIAPMYARIINDSVTPLDNLWDLDIPVDTHIRRLSQELLNMPDASDDRIREEWRGLAVEQDVSPAIVDGALWHIGNKWDDWGEDYWESLK